MQEHESVDLLTVVDALYAPLSKLAAISNLLRRYEPTMSGSEMAGIGQIVLDASLEIEAIRAHADESRRRPDREAEAQVQRMREFNEATGRRPATA